MAALTTDDCDAVITKLKNALSGSRPAGITYIQDPLGGQTRFESTKDLTDALERWQKLRNQIAFDENRSAAVAARRKPF